MKFAILGYSREALSFVQGAIRLGHEFVAAYDAGSEKTAIREVAPLIRFRDDWENLLAQRDVDAVLVAGPWLTDAVPSDARERRDDQLRKLFQAAVPLLIIPPVCEAIVGFELEMIRKDVQGIVIPVMPAPLHAAWDDLSAWLSKKSASAIGPIEVVSIERYLPVRQRPDVLPAFVQDIEPLRRGTGPFKRITASGGGLNGEAKPSLASLVVHAQGDLAFPVRWSVLPAGDFVGAKLIVLDANDRVTLTMPGDALANSASWHLQGPGLDRTYEPFEGIAEVLSELENAIAQGAKPIVTWGDACRAVEAMEAIDRSIARGRAVDLYNEEHSEESSFKGIMAAGGCLLLLATLGAFMLAGVGAALFRPAEGSGQSVWGWLQVCLIVPLVIFLLAQLLSFGLASHRRRKTNLRS